HGDVRGLILYCIRRVRGAVLGRVSRRRVLLLAATTPHHQAQHQHAQRERAATDDLHRETLLTKHSGLGAEATSPRASFLARSMTHRAVRRKRGPRAQGTSGRISTSHPNRSSSSSASTSSASSAGWAQVPIGTK